MIIYKTTNLINGKFYIGKDSRNSPSYFGSGLALLKAIEKYGKKNFKKEILQKCFSLEELSKAEIQWAEKLNAYDRKIAYNIAKAGQGGDLGKEVNRQISIGVSRYCKERTPEQKAERLRKFKETIANRSTEEKKILFDNMSKAKKGQICWCKGKKLSQEIISKMKKPKSEEHKQKLRNRIRSAEHSANISKAKLGKPLLKTRKRVKQLDLLTGKTIKIWESMTEAAKALKTTCSNIKTTIDGKTRYCKGYKWSYI